MKGDRAFGLVTLLVAIGYIASAAQIPPGFLVDPLGPKTFPFIIGTVAAMCGISMILRPDKEPEWPVRKTFFKLFAALVVLLFYSYALKPMGFLIPTAIASALLSYQIRPNARSAVITGVLLSVGLLLIFKHALGSGLFAFPRSWTD